MYKVLSKFGVRYNQSYAKNKECKKKKQGNDHAKTERRGKMLNGCACQNGGFLGKYFISASILFCCMRTFRSIVPT